MAENGMQMDTTIKAFSASVGFNSSNSSSAESEGLVATVFAAVYGKLVCEEVQALTAVWHHLAAGDVKAAVTQSGVEAAFRGGDHSFQDEPSFFEDPVEASETMFGAMDTDGDGRVTCDEFLAFYNMMAENGMQMDTTIKAFSASVGL